MEVSLLLQPVRGRVRVELCVQARGPAEQHMQKRAHRQEARGLHQEIRSRMVQQ